MNSTDVCGWHHCEEEDCYFCTPFNPFPEPPTPPLPPYMPDYIYEAMLQAEENNKDMFQKSVILIDRSTALGQKIQQKMKWIEITKKKVREAEIWISNADKEIDKLNEERDRLENSVRVTKNFIATEKTQYPLQFPNLG